jgi:CheY-specific phosphatase CheX
MNTFISSSAAHFDLMSAHLGEAALDLFAECDMHIEPSEAGPQNAVFSDELSCMASIGYVGDGVRGVLVLAASHAAAKAWITTAGITDCDLADTIGEFSNMLLGHLKARLLREGIPISLATPVTVSGAGLRLSMPPGYTCWQFFDGPGWRVGARLDASFESSFRVQEVDERQYPASPGEAILF